MSDKKTPEKAIHDLTLALLYLTCFTENNSRFKTASELPRAWKSYDWDALDKLSEEEYTFDRHGNKGLYLTEEGIRKAKEILEQYGISDWEINNESK